MDTKQRVLASVVFVALDLLFIYLYAGDHWKTKVNTIQKAPLKYSLAFTLATYVLLIIGLNLFVLPNIRADNRLRDSLTYGLLFGIVVYGVFECTSGVLFTDWMDSLFIVDTLWGGVLFFLAAYLGSICC